MHVKNGRDKNNLEMAMNISKRMEKKKGNGCLKVLAMMPTRSLQSKERRQTYCWCSAPFSFNLVPVPHCSKGTFPPLIRAPITTSNYSPLFPLLFRCKKCPFTSGNCSYLYLRGAPTLLIKVPFHL